MKIRFTRRAATDFQYWQKNNVKVYERVRLLIKAAHADPFCGIGKPERLRHHKNPALYSRRIDREHRLVYSVTDGELTVIACRFHYESL
ncbi:Txe/YoeB family addiction module toxin [Serratia symbiotica]|uniref:Txe/YoeB family addiction module toxin n=1 Tax=Serratia symbiotica TaxID=138074 RepID=UPI0008FFA247|nr:Txe/YoeB family addiction module toxin [Serratia symbiotica]